LAAFEDFLLQGAPHYEFRGHGDFLRLSTLAPVIPDYEGDQVGLVGEITRGDGSGEELGVGAFVFFLILVRQSDILLLLVLVPGG
jgi:hypothetical protein